MHPKLHLLKIISCAAVAVVLLWNTTASAQDGIYADFKTSMGTFTCKLDHSLAPKTVANFIGLATGERPWIDMTKGTIGTGPFFDGLTFHRVIDGFMIQTGSRNGRGTDSPGYNYEDELKDSMKFDKPYLMGVANSGKDSNGAQFFITVASAPHLNGAYTLFGQVTTGTNVVMEISKVAVDENDKPLTNVTVQSVIIRRVGSTAQNFNINNKGLPVVTNYPVGLEKEGEHSFSFSFPNRQYAHNRLFVSTNLNTWTEDSLGIEQTSSFTNRVVRTNEVGPHFFRFTQTVYPATTLAPKSLANKVLILDLLTQSGTVRFRITHDTAGNATTYMRGFDKSGSNTFSYYLQMPYRAQLGYMFSEENDWPIEGTLNFDTPKLGTFLGVEYWLGGIPIDRVGTFQISD